MDNLTNALNTWNDKLAEIWQLLTASPVSYNGGAVWGVMTGIHGALQAIGYGLLVLFFAAGVVKTCGSFAEVRRPEQALKLFVRFALAKAAVDFSMDLILAVFDIVQGMISQVIGTAGASGIGTATLPQELVDTINACGFWGEHPAVGGHAHRQFAHHGAVLCHGADRIRADVFPLDVRRHRAGAAVRLCRRTHQQRGQKLFAQLCRRLPARSGHCAGLHHFFGAFHQCAGSRPQRQRHHGGVVLCGRTGFQFVGAGRGRQGVRPDRQGDHGAVTEIRSLPKQAPGFSSGAG